MLAGRSPEGEVVEQLLAPEPPVEPPQTEVVNHEPLDGPHAPLSERSSAEVGARPTPRIRARATAGADLLKELSDQTASPTTP